jgi:hypothetical protein
MPLARNLSTSEAETVEDLSIVLAELGATLASARRTATMGGKGSLAPVPVNGGNAPIPDLRETVAGLACKVFSGHSACGPTIRA